MLFAALFTTLFMMFMGAKDSERGQYQAFTKDSGGTLMLDTQSGKLYTFFPNEEDGSGWRLRANGF